MAGTAAAAAGGNSWLGSCALSHRHFRPKQADELRQEMRLPQCRWVWRGGGGGGGGAGPERGRPRQTGRGALQPTHEPLDHGDGPSKNGTQRPRGTSGTLHALVRTCAGDPERRAIWCEPNLTNRYVLAHAAPNPHLPAIYAGSSHSSQASSQKNRPRCWPRRPARIKVTPCRPAAPPPPRQLVLLERPDRRADRPGVQCPTADSYCPGGCAIPGQVGRSPHPRTMPTA
jgi:hypothetical protein